MKANFVEVDLKEYESGIVSVKIDAVLQKILQELELKGGGEVEQEVFVWSGCVKRIGLFEDHFRVAVAHDIFDLCVIGLRTVNKPNWHLVKSKNELSTMHGPSQLTKFYISKDHVRVLRLPYQTNYSL